MPAPYSDNLYSADTDDENEHDALSPTDGYFNTSAASSSPRSPYVPNVLVEDPTLPSRDTKIQEAQRERQLLNSGPSTDTRDEPGNRSQVDASGAPNLIAPTPYSQQASYFAHPVDAPPAYSPSPASPTTASTYQTFTSTATMGRPEESQPLFIRAPESMSNPPNPNRQPSRWHRFKSVVTNLCKKIRAIITSVVILSVVFMVISSFTLWPDHGEYHDPIEDMEPVAPPSQHRDDFTWNPSGLCLDKPYRFVKHVDAVDIRPSHNLTIVQTVKKNNNYRGRSTHISGEIVLRHMGDTSSPTFDVEVISNDGQLSVDVEYDRVTQRIEVTVPQKISWGSSDMAPCIQIRATLWAPRESVLNGLDIDSQQLDVKIDQGFVLGAWEGITIRTASGDIKTPSLSPNTNDRHVAPYTLSSRQIRIRTASGDVKGWYPLYDLLDIETVSGDISANVGPKPVNPNDIKPAAFRVHSASGKIEVQEPIARAQHAPRPEREFPPRDYTVDFRTASGDIAADVAVSSYAFFGSQSGDLKVHVWPVLDPRAAEDNEKPSLGTDTKSGTTQVTVLEPLWTRLAIIGAIPPAKPDAPNIDRGAYGSKSEESETSELGSVYRPTLSVLSSTHRSVSGRVKLFYPASWEGSLFAQSISGTQKFEGKDLRVTHEGSSFTKVINGQKGSGHSWLEVNTVSGDQYALIGEKDN
ncbi:hypothetical protein F66182_2949 [Fusarium sp. NRRL 66182]|nr:hypothetical protein F66182_2949 [Fusarium sp. NRRL 66182]